MDNERLLAQWTDYQGGTYVFYDYMGRISGGSSDPSVALAHARRMDRIARTLS